MYVKSIVLRTLGCDVSIKKKIYISKRSASTPLWFILAITSDAKKTTKYHHPTVFSLWLQLLALVEFYHFWDKKWMSQQKQQQHPPKFDYDPKYDESKQNKNDFENR